MNVSAVFSERVKQARLNAGLSARELADKAGYGADHIRKIERSDGGYNSRIQTVFDIAQALNTTPGYLLGLEDLPMARTGFVSPRKGTRTRALINLMLRPQGITIKEAVEKGLIKSPQSMSGIKAQLEYNCGFDIQVISSARNKRVGNGRHSTIYRIIGRHRWNGQYRPFVSVEEDIPV